MAKRKQAVPVQARNASFEQDLDRPSVFECSCEVRVGRKPWEPCTVRVNEDMAVRAMELSGDPRALAAALGLSGL